MLSKFRKCLLGIFALYELIFSAIRMDYIDNMALSYSAKFIFIGLVLIVELGVFYYASCEWEVYKSIKDVGDFECVKKYRKSMILAIIYSIIALICIYFDIRLAPSYFTGLLFNAIIISDLVCIVVYARAVINYWYNRNLA